MCGRFTQSDPERLAREFSDTGAPPRLPPPRYNIAPSQEIPVVRVLDPAKGRRLDALRWGLVPSFAKDPSIGHRMINARIETLETRTAFRDAVRRRRCLVVGEASTNGSRAAR